MKADCDSDQKSGAAFDQFDEALRRVAVARDEILNSNRKVQK